MKKCIALVAMALVFLSSNVLAQAAPDVAPAVSERILDKLREARGDLPYGAVKTSPIKGMYQVDIEGGPSLFVSADGNFFIAGDLFSVRPEGFVNVLEIQRAGDRAEVIATIPDDDMIIFSPREETKAVVYVFTDVDCGYCQKLHNEMAAYNELGIEIRYLAYPRAGPGSDTADKLSTAWCASDKQATLTRLKNRERVPVNLCAESPVDAQYALGRDMGVTGTPALITADGTMIPGYRPAPDLAIALGLAAAPAAQ